MMSGDVSEPAPDNFRNPSKAPFPQVSFALLSYAERLQHRDIDTIDLVVIHCTELPDLATAREYGERVQHAGSQTGNSGHFYIDRDGHTECWVPIDCAAHHVRGYNERSLGIELVNRGRWPHWYRSDCQHMPEAYPAQQVQALKQLLDQLERVLPALRWITGHEELDEEMVQSSDKPHCQVRRKMDPGPHFPWEEVFSSISLKRFHG